MRRIQRMFMTFGKAFPESFKAKVGNLLFYARIAVKEEVWLGVVFVYSLLLSILIALLASYIWELGFFLYLALFFGLLFVFFISAYFFLSYSAYQRAKQIEKNLPDALQLISANIRAGITPDKAILLSARPEFGVLSEEINLIGEETLAGKPVDEALIDFSKRVNSPLLKRVVGLIVEGMRSGGELASLLEKTADDIRMGEILQQEIQANIGAYVLFTIIAVLIAAPILYATSINFVDLSQSIRTAVGVTSIEAIPKAPIVNVNFPVITPQKSSIDVGVLRWFSIISLSISAIFASLVIGVLKYGEEKEGIKMIPVFLFIGLVVFFVVLVVLSKILSGIMAL